MGPRPDVEGAAGVGLLERLRRGSAALARSGCRAALQHQNSHPRSVGRNSHRCEAGAEGGARYLGTYFSQRLIGGRGRPP